jgi:hypothetical protein
MTCDSQLKDYGPKYTTAEVDSNIQWYKENLESKYNYKMTEQDGSARY